MRPPQRSRASRMVTFLPARASSRAAIRPAAPAPTIKTWAIKTWVGPRGAIAHQDRLQGWRHHGQPDCISSTTFARWRNPGRCRPLGALIAASVSAKSCSRFSFLLQLRVATPRTLFMHRLSFHDALDAGRLFSLPTIGALAVLVALACPSATAWAQTAERRTDPAIRP